jgi:hypothetical protein
MAANHKPTPPDCDEPFKGKVDGPTKLPKAKRPPEEKTKPHKDRPPRRPGEGNGERPIREPLI